MKKATVIGDGGWGTALALTLLKNGHEVTLWGPFSENLEEIRKHNENKFLKGVPIPAELKLEAEPEKAAAGADLIVLAAPSQFMRGTLRKFQNCLDPSACPIVDVAKGIENDSLKRMSEVFEDFFGKSDQYVALSGPSHAEEVSRNIPTAVVAASQNETAAKTVQEFFMSPTFRVYTADDVAGVELGGALKNVLAIAAGISDGMGLGDNTKAALMTRGIAEMARLGYALGGRKETFAGLSGVGDLIVTCMSRHSRNRFVGDELGKGKTMDEIRQEMGMSVAEGVKTSLSAFQLAEKTGIDTPLINAVYQVIYKQLSPKDAVLDLMTRPAKQEDL